MFFFIKKLTKRPPAIMALIATMAFRPAIPSASAIARKPIQRGWRRLCIITRTSAAAEGINGTGS